MEYHLGNCKAPCVCYQIQEEYDAQIAQMENLVKGNISSVIHYLKTRMNDHAVQQEYELAHEIKVKLQTLENYQAKSTIVSPSIHEVDIITLIDEPDNAFVNYLCIHNGAIIHAYTAEVKKKLNESREDVLGFVLPELRERFSSNSKEVLVDAKLDLKLEGITFTVPQRGDKKQLIELSLRNAKFYKLEKQKQEKIKDPERHTNRILEQLKSDFRLADLPIHMECFDNSNFQGTNAVSACIVFKNAKPSKRDYRHFNVKTVEGPDDFATMEEVVYRRYKRMMDEDQPLPQLIVIDGGKGQLGAALIALEKLELRGKVAIVGIAKRLEEIFFPGDQYPIYIDKRSESLKVVQFMRNEAHRFGITHHRNKRSKGALQSEITQIEGIGQKTQESLMNSFKTVSDIREATKEESTKVIATANATIILEYFNKT